jgi:hypothetical protein
MITMTEAQNPKLDLVSLDVIRGKIEKNLAAPEDYQTLDFFISSILGIQDYILNRLKSNGISSYEKFILERKDTPPEKHRLINIILYGHIIGAISYLTDYLNK